MIKVSLHRFARLPQRFLVALGLGLGILTAGAIAPPPSTPEAASTPAATKVDSQLSQLSQSLTAPATAWRSLPTNTPDQLSVTLYTPTASCETYEGKTQAVVTDQAIPQVVQLLLTDQTPQLLDFELAGYRVLPESKGQAVTIDLRRKPGTQRHFISLSICEQRILFGSLRETLLQNPALGIKTVEFTEQGRPIQL